MSEDALKIAEEEKIASWLAKTPQGPDSHTA
jgi:hypothetical protein